MPYNTQTARRGEFSHHQLPHPSGACATAHRGLPAVRHCSEL